MAQTKQPLSERKQINQRETFRYRPSRSPAARPQGIQGPATSSASNRLVQLSKVLQQGQNIMGQYGQFKEQEYARQEEEGAKLAAAGKELPKDSPEAKIAGFMRVKGQGDSYDFRMDAFKYAQENKDKPVEEFREGLSDLIDDYIEGRPQEYAEGFVPEAQKHESRIIHQYMEHQNEQMQQEAVYSGVKIFSSEIAELMEETDSPDVFAKKSREKLTEIQEHLKDTSNVPRDRVSQAIMNAVGREAERRGMPELLGFFDTTDKDGISLGMKFPKLARVWQERAEAVREQDIEQSEARYEKRREEFVEQAERSFVTNIQESLLAYNTGYDSEGNPYDYEDLRQDALEMKSELFSRFASAEEDGIAFDPDTLESMLINVNDMLEIDGFASTADPEAENALISAMTEIRDEDSWQDFRRTLSRSKEALTEKKYNSYFQQGQQKWLNMSDREVREASTYFNKSISDGMRALGSGDGPLASLGIGTPKDGMRIMLFNRKARHKYRRLEELHDGKVPMEKTDKIIEEAMTFAKEEFPMKSFETPEGDTGEEDTTDDSNENDDDDEFEKKALDDLEEFINQ